MCQIVAAVENQIVTAKEYELNATIWHFLRKTTQWSRMSQIVHCVIPWETVRAGKEIICKTKLRMISFVLLPSFLDMANIIIICFVLCTILWILKLPNSGCPIYAQFLSNFEWKTWWITSPLIHRSSYIFPWKICPSYQKPDWLILEFLKVLCFF